MGTPIKTTVNFVPNLFLKTPENAVAKVAPKAIIATIHENWFLDTGNSLSSEKSRGAAGDDQPSKIPKMKAPPYAVKAIASCGKILIGPSFIVSDLFENFRVNKKFCREKSGLYPIFLSILPVLIYF